MGEFNNGRLMKTFASLLCTVVIIINIFFVSTTLTESLDENTGWYIYLVIALGATFYAVFVGYLTIYMFISMGFEGLINYQWVQKYYNVQEYLEEKKNYHEKIATNNQEYN